MCGIKIKSGDEVVRKIWQNEYKKPKKYQFKKKNLVIFWQKLEKKTFQFWRKMEEEHNNYAIMQGIWMRECGKKNQEWG